MTEPAVFRLTRNGNPIASLALGDVEQMGDEQSAVPVNELQRCGFQINHREQETEYHLWIGDRDPVRSNEGGMVRLEGGARGASVYWDDSPYFDGARGRVWVRLGSRPGGSQEPWLPRARLPVYVCTTKLSEERYNTMLAQLRRLAAGLVFDLVSPMVRTLGLGESEHGVSHRSSQLELHLLERLWSSVSPALREIVNQPVTRIARIEEMRLSWGAERFGPRTTARLAAEGLDPRRPGLPRPFPALQERFTESHRTVEHRVIAGLLRFLRQRVAACAGTIRQHVQGIEGDRPFRQRSFDAGLSLYDVEDAPRVERLRKTFRTAEKLRREIARVQALPLFQEQPGAGWGGSLAVAPVALPTTPVFEHVRPYRRIRDEFRRYLRSSLILLQDGFEERLKSTHRMYEQWVFLQLAAAFRQAGLRCTNQEGLFQRSRNFRFTLDVDRGARLTFLAGDGRAIVLRFEPWIFSHDIARQRGETLYRGSGKEESAWSPDVLIEIVRPHAAGLPEVEYAVVVDAKYTGHIQEHHWNDTRKYLKIRATSNRRQVVRQLWLAYLGPNEQIALEDSAVTWTAQGLDCGEEEVVEGRLSLVPPTRDPDAGEEETGWIGSPESAARMFVQGLLNFRKVPHSLAESGAAAGSVSHPEA